MIVRQQKLDFIQESIGSQSIIGEALATNIFNKDGMTKLESIFHHDYEDFIYQMSLLKTTNI